jgi:HD-GYP domain-containing protein (c-di-GMP phosphodiesterase class II)
MNEPIRVIDIALECLIAGMCDRNPDEWHHCRRVERICGLVARELDWTPEDIADLKLAALLHHLDRSHVPETALTPCVAAYLHRFAERAGQAEQPQRRDRSREDEAAEIIAVADSFDRLVSPQRYRRPINETDAIKMIRYDAGTIFSEAVVEAFCRIYDVGLDTPESQAA